MPGASLQRCGLEVDATSKRQQQKSMAHLYGLGLGLGGRREEVFEELGVADVEVAEVEGAPGEAAPGEESRELRLQLPGLWLG